MVPPLDNVFDNSFSEAEFDKIDNVASAYL